MDEYAVFKINGTTSDFKMTDGVNEKLQQGEVALFTADNYQGTAFVFPSYVEDSSISDAAASMGLVVGDNGAAPECVGPDTLAILRNDAQFGGGSTAEDIPRIGALGVSSLKSVEPRQYVLESDGCLDCDLTGIDLSDLGLAGASFTGAILTGLGGKSVRRDLGRCERLHGDDRWQGFPGRQSAPCRLKECSLISVGRVRYAHAEPDTSRQNTSSPCESGKRVKAVERLGIATAATSLVAPSYAPPDGAPAIFKAVAAGTGIA